MYKLIFTLLGYLLLGFWGALFGFFVGNIIDRARKLGLGAVNPLTTAHRQSVFLETAFILMGRLAKVDGHISQAEISQTEDFIKKMNLSAEHRKIAIEQFKRGSDPDFDIRPQLDTFIAVCGQTLHLKQVLLLYLMLMALADGQLDPAEKNLLQQIALHLGYSRSEFSTLLDMVMSQTHFSQTQATTQTLQDAYQALGVSEKSSDQEIKRAYRKLISQYHPDKLIGQGLPEDMIAVATEQAKEIQLAYDLIKKHRHIR